MESQRRQRTSFVGALLAVALAVFLSVLLTNQTEGATQAQTRRTSTPTVTRTITQTVTPTATPRRVNSTWKSRGLTGVPVNLQQTGGLSARGGGGPMVYDLCPDVFGRALLRPESYPIFLVSEATISRSTLPAANWFLEPFWVQSCDGVGEDEVVIDLYDPNGDWVEPVRYYYIDDETEDMLPAYTLASEYEFTIDSLEGIYNLEIWGEDFYASKEIVLDVVDWITDGEGPRYFLRESISGEERSTFAPGETIEIEYTRLYANEEFDVGLYRFNSSAHATLIDWWHLQADSEGRARESLPIPDGITTGDYALLVSPVGSLDSVESEYDRELAEMQGAFGLAGERQFFRRFTIDDGTEDPTDVVRAYFASIEEGIYSEGDFRAAYNQLSQDWRNRQSRNEFVAGFANTTSLTVKDVELTAIDGRTAQVFVFLSSSDEIDGQYQENEYDINYYLIWENGRWMINDADVEVRAKG